MPICWTVVNRGTPSTAGESITPYITMPLTTLLSPQSARAQPDPARALTTRTTVVTQTETTSEFTNQLVMLPVDQRAFHAWAVQTFGSQCGGISAASASDLSEVNRAAAIGATNTAETATPSSVRTTWLGVQGLRDLVRAVVAVRTVGSAVVIGRSPHGCAAATSAPGRRLR